ncbi:hypothetical protein Vqi01_14180 [Micromonospora qiuiae]|uniref:Uncharacterized protein n=1 Tax=Micromonospora qiuiae TaxID=502268 RepID=A0ABQ4J8C1_9ACTN|nr:hypothetical protein Vqi01_14180 [Micromonospora qiuiae]
MHSNDPTRKYPQTDISEQGSSRKAAQTSSVAERLTAVQPTPQAVAEFGLGTLKRVAPGRSERNVPAGPLGHLRLMVLPQKLPTRWPSQARKVLLMPACLAALGRVKGGIAIRWFSRRRHHRRPRRCGRVPDLTDPPTLAQLRQLHEHGGRRSQCQVAARRDAVCPRSREPGRPGEAQIT